MSGLHTPGPWEPFLGSDSVWVTGPDHNANVVCDIVLSAKEATDEDFANARLIAAAPSLLEASKLAQDLLVASGFACSEVLSRVSAAIAKAEGR